MTAADGHRPEQWRAARAALALGWRASPPASLALAVSIVLTGALPAAAAWLGKLLFDELARGTAADASRVVPLAVAAAAGVAVTTVAATATGYFSAAAEAAITIEAEAQLVGVVSRLRGLGQFENPQFLDRLRLAEQGAREAPAAVNQFWHEGVRTLIAVSAFGGAVLIVWPPMALLLVASLVPALVSQLTLAKLRVRSHEVTSTTQRRRYLYRFLVSDVRAAKETRLFGLTDLFQARMLAALRSATDVELAVQRRVMLVGVGLAGLSAAVSAIAMVVAALHTVRGNLTLGDVTLFTAAVAAIQSAVIGMIGRLGDASASLRLFDHYLSVVHLTDDLPDGTAAVPPLRRGVELRDVWFRYDPDGPWVLRGVDLTIPRGAAVGLVGLNGAGKTTLVKLLCRFYDPQQGQILWDGRDIRGFTVSALRARIGATFQDYMTYDLSAAENVGIGDIDRMSDHERIRDAARMAELDEHFSSLPQGYDTLLSRTFANADRGYGVTLSGGQWQRVALARSLMRDRAQLLILDEPSSGLDAEAEHRIHHTLRAHRAGRTSLLVSHRLSALRDADLIVVLRDGAVTERGRHSELIGSGGDYARLFALQARGYVEQASA